MKWLLLVNDAQILSEFLGKLSKEILDRGDQCTVVFNSKIAEFGKKQFFPEGVKHISKIDWCIERYQKNSTNFHGLSWKDTFTILERFNAIPLDYNVLMKITSCLCQFFEDVFASEKPDIVIAEAPADLFHEIPYLLCKKNNIPYLGMEDSKFENRNNIYDNRADFSKIRKTFAHLKSEDITTEEKQFIKKFLDDFLSHSVLPGYSDFSMIKGVNQVKIVRHYIKRLREFGSVMVQYLKGRKRFREFDYESEVILKNGLRAPLEMEVRQFKTLFPQYSFHKLRDDDKDFYLFPLHYQPESSTAVYATYYYDQLNTVKNVAFSLPFPYKLFVKEHPASVGLRTEAFYRALKKIPNVVVVGADENVQQLIRRSKGVIVLTSTIGMEAAMLGKTTYVLGDVFYSYHPLCREIKNYEQLKEEIVNDLSVQKPVDHLEDINARFIISYWRNTLQGSVASAAIGKDINDYALIYKTFKQLKEEKNAT